MRTAFVLAALVVCDSALAGLSLHVSCFASPDTQSGPIVPRHQLAITKPLPPGCIKDRTELPLERLADVSIVQLKPSPVEIAVRKHLKENLPPGGTLDPPNTVMLMIEVSLDDKPALENWTRTHVGKFIAVTSDGKMVAEARLMGVLGDGRIGMLSERSLEDTEKLARELRAASGLTPN